MKSKVKQPKDIMEVNKGEEFVCLFSNIRNVAKNISGMSLAISLVLSSYIKNESNLLIDDETGMAINNNDIIAITGYSNMTVIKCMTELVENMVFARIKQGTSYNYYANPYIFCKSSKVDSMLVDMFEEYDNEEHGCVQIK